MDFMVCYSWAVWLTEVVELPQPTASALSPSSAPLIKHIQTVTLYCLDTSDGLTSHFNHESDSHPETWLTNTSYDYFQLSQYFNEKNRNKGLKMINYSPFIHMRFLNICVTVTYRRDYNSQHIIFAPVYRKLLQVFYVNVKLKTYLHWLVLCSIRNLHSSTQSTTYDIF